MLGTYYELLHVNTIFRMKHQKTVTNHMKNAKRGGWDLNPRVLADMGLAIPRPTRLGDPRSRSENTNL
jgi:signal transduction histidine kinase